MKQTPGTIKYLLIYDGSKNRMLICSPFEKKRNKTDNALEEFSSVYPVTFHDFEDVIL